MWARQDSIGAWIELFAWLFWVIAFELDQGCNCYPVLGSWATMISSSSTLVATSSVERDWLCPCCAVSVERDVV